MLTKIARVSVLALGCLLSPPIAALCSASAQTATPYSRDAMEQALATKHAYDLYGIHFDVDEATIQPDTKPLLDDIAAALRNFPAWRLRIVGHTDASGKAARNERLSMDRANAIKQALVARGIDASRLEASGMGESRPVASNDTAEGKALNRRVELARIDVKPNVVIIWGDDIGQSDVSAYSRGLMGFQTPNIDRIAKEGVMFTDYYAEQSCTAGRASFITGQSGLRTGMTKVGLPGAKLGLQKEDPTIATLLKPLGYATGQFGKNHLGDRNEFLPTVHGFDEFFGPLYHLNASEEPQLPDYPKNPEFLAKYGPRGVLDCKASEKDDPTEDPRFGRVGKQACTDTGPLTKERMLTIDDDIANRSVDFIKRQHEADKPFFVWVNFTHMHLRTHTKPESLGQAGRWQSPYHDTMIDHDKNVGEVLKALDDLGIADNTFVMYSTDNGPHMNTWPDAGMTPFRNEKNSNWEGAYRVPAMVRWPGHIKPDTVSNGIVSHHDMLPTILAMAGDPDVTDELLKGKTIGDMTYKVHIDGFNLVPYLTGQTDKDPRQSFFYINDDQQLVALRYDNWKIVFMKQETPGTLAIWANPFTNLRLPELYNLRTDPYERATITSNTYYDWFFDHAFLLVPAQDYVGQFLATLKDYPPRQKAESFNLDTVMSKLKQPDGAPD